MTETINLIKRHGSVRSYKPDPVPVAMVEEIIRAGQQSSTSSNLQMYSVVAVTDKGKKDKLAALCSNQLFIREAPVFLVWCADLSRLDRICDRQGYEQVSRYVENFLLATVDTAILMQTAATAAESLGLGMCYVGAIRNQPRDVIALLDLPHLVFPVAGMALGWPAAAPRIRPRLPLNAVLHWERYDTKGEEEQLRAYDEAMIATGIYEGRKVSSEQQADNADIAPYGWVEHSARRVSRAIRIELSAILHEQGYCLD